MRIAVAGGTGVVGRHVVEHAKARGHTVCVLARSKGIDLITGSGLDLTWPDGVGVDAVIDVSGPRGTKAMAYFDAATRNLQAAAERASVKHYVALSIVGARANPYGYYAAKARQEQLVESGSVPWTILRTTQFFEFSTHNAIGFGPWALVAKMRSRPVSTDSVAKRLLDIAEGEPVGVAQEFAGPDELWMADLARMAFETHGERRPVIQIPLPGKFGKALRNGGILPAKNATIDSVSYEDWLAAGAE